MKLVINCDPDDLTEAMAVLVGEIPRIDRYDRPGWGWVHYGATRRWFVRGLKDGLSIAPAPLSEARK